MGPVLQGRWPSGLWEWWLFLSDAWYLVLIAIVALTILAGIVARLLSRDTWSWRRRPALLPSKTSETLTTFAAVSAVVGWAAWSAWKAKSKAAGSGPGPDLPPKNSEEG